MRDLSRDIQSLHIERTNRPPGRSRRMWLIALCVVVLLALIVIAALQAYPRLFKPVVSVSQISVISPAQAEVKLIASGYVVPMRHAVISSKQPGRLEAVLVKEGDEVREGQVLATLESADLRASLNDARAALASARARVAGLKATLGEARLQLDREKRLLGRGGATQASADSAQSRLNIAVASLQPRETAFQAASARVVSAEVALSYARITAPFSGRIVRKMAEAGEVPTAVYQSSAGGIVE